MDPATALGLAGSIIACIQLAQALSKQIGLSEHNRADLEYMLKTLRGFLAACECLKDIAALDESEGRFSLVEQAQEPLKECQQAIDFIHERLKEKNLFRRWVRGSAWDRKIKKRLLRLDDIKAQFDMAIQSDQLQLIAAVEKYSQQAVCGTRDIREDTQYIKHAISQQGPLLSSIKSTQDAEAQGQQALPRNLYALLINRETASKKRDLFNWLSTAEPTTNHDSARKHFEPNTGSWLLQSTKYDNWKGADNSFLWLQGLPGCGKTILCSTIVEDIIDHRAQNANCLMAYYYFSFTETEKQNANNFLRSIITQLLKQDDAVLDDVLVIFEGAKNSTPHLGTLKIILKTILKTHWTFFLIADALDECPRGYEPDERQRNNDVNADTRRYIKTQLEKDRNFQKWSLEIRTETETTLTEGANGMFRWVFCQLDSLKRCRTTRQLRVALKSLPKTLNATYHRLISEIREEDTEIAIAALKWLVICETTLTIAQLAEATAMGFNSRAPFDVENRLADPCDLFHILGSLVSVDMTYGEEEIKLAHFSVREYLTSGLANDIANFNELDTHRFALECCLNYMDSSSMGSGDENHAFNHYAVYNWQIHAWKYQNHHHNIEIAEYIILFLGSWSWREKWLIIRREYGKFIRFENKDDLGTALFYACHFKLVDVCKILIDRYNVAAIEPLLLGNYDPLDVACHLGELENVALYILNHKIWPSKKETDVLIHRALNLTALKGDDHLFHLLTELVIECRRTWETKAIILKIIDYLPKRADGYPWWKHFSNALLASDNEISTIYIRDKVGVKPDWPSSELSKPVKNIFPLEILMSGMKDRYFPPEHDSIENDRSIEELLLSHGAIRDQFRPGSVPVVVSDESVRSEMEVDGHETEAANVMVDADEWEEEKTDDSDLEMN
ncbi:hypothetical protein NHQ30_009667 [Ciborinia camelliae]|nr:hypothetical protein NHQ30_009667 [Ciborinia camelliae]